MVGLAQEQPKEQPKTQETPTPKKKPATFGNSDFGTPDKSPSSTIGDDKEAYDDRKAIIKIEETDPKAYQEKLVNLFFEKQSQGKPTDYFFCKPLLATSLFAVRSWTVVDKSSYDQISIFTLRVDSSNKGGQPVTALWQVTVLQSEYKDFCVSTFKEKQK